MTDSPVNSCETNVSETNVSKFENRESLGSPSNNDKSNRRHYRQLYKKDWEENPLFKGELLITEKVL